MSDKEKLERLKIDLQFETGRALALGVGISLIPIVIELIILALDYVLNNLVDRDGKRYKFWRNVGKYARFGLFMFDKVITLKK